jgi:hypothetical protein
VLRSTIPTACGALCVVTTTWRSASAVFPVNDQSSAISQPNPVQPNTSVTRKNRRRRPAAARHGDDDSQEIEKQQHAHQRKNRHRQASATERKSRCDNLRRV